MAAGSDSVREAGRPDAAPLDGGSARAPALQGTAARGPAGIQSPPVALTIAGSDSGGGAGIQADLKTFTAFRVYGASALTAVTAQNTLGVTDALALPAALVLAQIAAVRSDFDVAATKIGMLADVALVTAVAQAVRAAGLGAVVLDPVMVSKSGHPLLSPDAVTALRTLLLPLVDVLTPNLPEAAALLGCEERALVAPAARRDAARALAALGPRCVVVKGGHGALDSDGFARDVWYDGDRFGELVSPRIETPHTHGTGCTFSSAVAAGLARGWALTAALAAAKAYVATAIAAAPGLGHGHGPIQHLLPDAGWEALRARAGERVEGLGPAGAAPSPMAPSSFSDAAALPTAPSALPPPGPARVARLRRLLACYVITDRGLQRGRDEVEVAAAALQGGATTIQLRGKGLEARTLCGLGERLLPLCVRHGALLLINDRLDVALACGAHGVHLGQDDLPAAVARRLAGPDLVIGVSAATPGEAAAARSGGADYLGVGSVYATSTKADAGAPIGTRGLAWVAASSDLPVVAVGGIAAENVAEVVAAGAAGVAVISAVVGAEDVRAAAARLASAVGEARARGGEGRA